MDIVKMIDKAAEYGFRTVISKDANLYTIGFERNGKWSPPYGGFTLDEAVKDATEDIMVFKEDTND